MSFLCYVRARLVPLIAAFIGIISAITIAKVCGCPTEAVVLMAIVLFMCASCAFVAAYLHSRRFYSELGELAENLEHPYQLHSFIGEPYAFDHAIVFDALKTMGTASAEEVASANAKADEHREFVEGWVHDVKAPLASCGLIAKRVEEPERALLASELDRIGRKVDTALWYARADCANQDYAIHETVLSDIPRKVLRDDARYLIEHGCIPEIDIDDDVVVFTDKKQAAFIVSQLVENAAKYGATRIRFYASWHDADTGSGHVDLCVEDNGRGIPASEINRVFERGFTGTRGREGARSTGMGLYLSARLCEQLGLGLSICSVDGEGTRATITFPLDRRRLDVECDRDVRLP
ncbi:MAG: HAMP domain-containing histidine kinase [Eggerthellaceae bacterium]|nr:HAMP domain-containing histidine kinase [Eggerthellaceae bacterium]